LVQGTLERPEPVPDRDDGIGKESHSGDFLVTDGSEFFRLSGIAAGNQGLTPTPMRTTGFAPAATP